jgi:hypothetical protein
MDSMHEAIPMWYHCRLEGSKFEIDQSELMRVWKISILFFPPWWVLIIIHTHVRLLFCICKCFDFWYSFNIYIYFKHGFSLVAKFCNLMNLFSKNENMKKKMMILSDFFAIFWNKNNLNDSWCYGCYVGAWATRTNGHNWVAFQNTWCYWDQTQSNF